MDVKKIFNIILLTLSLSTIFITLVSYLIFKLRQAAAGKSSEGKFELEGTYFRKYAPHLEETNKKEQELKIKKESSPRAKAIKISSLIIFVVLITFTMFLFEDYFTYRKQLKDRFTSAQEFKELIRGGLLKKYEYTPHYDLVEMNETIPPKAAEQYSLYSSYFSKEKFCIASTVRAKFHNNIPHMEGLRRWKAFFNRHKLKYGIYKNVKEKHDCIWIIPHVSSFSGRERVLLEKVLNNKTVLITGAFATKNGIGKSAKTDYFKDLFLNKPLKESKTTPTIINSNSSVLSEVPSGRLLNWHPVDLHFSYVLGKSEVDLSVANYDGIPDKYVAEDITSYKSRLILKDHYAWTSLDPMLKEGIEQYYSDLYLLGILYKISHKSMVKISNWKDQVLSPLIFLLSINDGAIPYIDMIDYFDKMEAEYALAVKAPYLRKIFEDLKHKEKVELAAINIEEDNIKVLEGRESFDFFEKERFELEEISKIKVEGFVPFKEIFFDKTLDGINQNHLSYLFGGKRVMSHSPVFVKNANFVYIPRVIEDSTGVEKDLTLVHPEEFYQRLKEDFDIAQSVNGIYVSSTSNTAYSDPLFRKGMEKFIEENKDIAQHFSKIVNWLKVRSDLTVKIEGLPGEEIATITNNTSTETGAFILLVDKGSHTDEVEIENIDAGKSFSIDLADI